VEASIRPYAEGCASWPVGYVEGWFVDADVRRHGIGKKLVRAAEQWATGLGCREMASDAHPENKVSLIAHKALGFEEAERAVHLRKRLTEVHGKTVEQRNPSRPQTLLLLAGTFAVCKLEPTAPIPPWTSADELFSITRTGDELSIVCRQDAVPEGILCERGWRCWRVTGTIPFSVVGVLASLTAPLAEAGICMFAISTFDTDYLVRLACSPRWRLEVEQNVRHGPPDADRLVRLAGASLDDMLKGRIDGPGDFGVRDGSEVVLHGRASFSSSNRMTRSVLAWMLCRRPAACGPRFRALLLPCRRLALEDMQAGGHRGRVFG
jgi:hypothetical protein